MVRMLCTHLYYLSTRCQEELRSAYMRPWDRTMNKGRQLIFSRTALCSTQDVRVPQGNSWPHHNGCFSKDVLPILYACVAAAFPSLQLHFYPVRATFSCLDSSTSLHSIHRTQDNPRSMLFYFLKLSNHCWTQNEIQILYLPYEPCMARTF